MILDLIEKNKDITQREISESLGVAVSMINNYIDDYESKGLIKRKRYSTKTVEYFVTRKGIERKKILNISYLNDSLKVIKSASEDIVKFLNQIIDRGFKDILLYGAGEVAEILLQTLKIRSELPINIKAVIDDDNTKHDLYLVGFKIIPTTGIDNINHDGILISSYTNRKAILQRLLDIKYDRSKIINFFDDFGGIIE